jgi:uncharacterized protein YheU (UPF0270 family)
MMIPHTSLDPDVLFRIIESFVLREGTDYGHGDYTLEQKVEAVMRQLRRGDVVLTWDAEIESCNIVSKQTAREATR